MTNEQMERHLASAVEKTAPDDVNGVLSRCEERKGTVIPMTTKKTTKRRWTSLIAACLAVMLLGGGLFYQQVNAVASVVSLDVNPSIELKVNRSEKVLVCTPLNEDAKAILADMGSGADLKGAKLDVAVNAIVGSLVRNGYLNSISSAIMISVEDKDTARAEKLQRELTSTVDGVLQTSESRASVLTQTLTQDAGLTQQARENSISTGKAALVNRILAINPTLQFDALAKLSVEELKNLAEAGAPAMPIGKDKALSIAAAAFSRDLADEIRYSEVDAELDLDAINREQLNAAENVPVCTDIGGVAGYSSGIIQSCTNSGSVGYDHVGYNIGGIVGRQSGYLDGCANSGDILGRKDVGGVAGQLEPEVRLLYDQGQMGELLDALDGLGDLLDQTQQDLRGTSDALSDRMDAISARTDEAREAVGDLADSAADWTNENIEELNSLTARISWLTDQLAPILDDAVDVMDLVEDLADELGNALDEVGAA